MKSILRQFICLTWLLLLPVLFFNGCGKAEENKYEELLVVDVFDTLANYQGIQSGWYGKIIEDKFNMKLNIIAPNVAGGGDSLFDIRAAAGNLGDIIIFGNSNDNLQHFVDSGLLYDMSSDIESKEIMHYKDAIYSLHENIDQDGIYAIPSEISRYPADTPSEGLEPNYGPYVRWDIYKEMGYPQVKDIDSLLDILEEMQRLNPLADNGKKTYVFSLFKDWDNNMMSNAKQLAGFYGYDEQGFVLAKADGSDYQHILEDDSWYIKALKMFFEANQRGLLDPESSVQNYNEMFEKYQKGEVLFSFWPWLGQAAYNTAEHINEGKGFMMIPIDDMEVFSYGCNPKGNHNMVIGIGSQAKDPERLVDFIDWLYSAEGIMISEAKGYGGAAGPMGLTWEMEDGMPVLTEFGKAAFYGTRAEVPKEWGEGTWDDGVCELNYKIIAMSEITTSGFTYYYDLWDSVQREEDSPLHADWKEYMEADSTMDYLEDNKQLLIAPGSTFIAPREDSEIITKRSQCRDIIVNYSWKMIYAQDEEEFLSLYNNMLAIVTDLGYEDVLEVDMENAKLQSKSRKEAL